MTGATAIRTDRDDGSRLYTHPVTGDQLVSVTTVLGATDGKQRYLVPWAARIAAEYAVDNLDHVAEVLAQEGRQAGVDLVKNQAEQIRKRKADAGTYVHDVQEALILWAASPDGTGRDIAIPALPDHLTDVYYDDSPLEDVVDWMITGFTRFVAAFNPVFEAAEMTVYNRGLGVAGTLDMILTLRDVRLTPDGRLVYAPGARLVLCVDTKTGKHLDVTVKEQVAAYRRMREALMPMGDLAPMPATDAGAVLHLRPEHHGGFRLMPVSPRDDALAWNRFRRAAEIYRGRAEAPAKPGKVAYPPNPDGTMPTPLLADLDGEGYGRALAALTNAGLADLDEVAAHTASAIHAIKGIGAKTAETVRAMLAAHGRHLADDSPSQEVA